MRVAFVLCLLESVYAAWWTRSVPVAPPPRPSVALLVRDAGGADTTAAQAFLDLSEYKLTSRRRYLTKISSEQQGRNIYYAGASAC
jgi:hypothetical protein